MISPVTDSKYTEYWAAVEWLLGLIQDPQGLRYLSSRTPSERLLEMQQQIPRLANFLEFAGNPQERFNTIHVAGTSGKGSVTHMVASILKAAGVNVGHHISPYLQVCNEKLVARGREISPGAFVELVSEFQELLARWQAANPANFLKYGEAWVALTFLFFAKEQIEWAVLETGMGGLYDPTNVVQSKLAIITNIDFDHTESLGDTLEEIAFHKAGIIKPFRPVISGAVQLEAQQVIHEIARSNQSSIYQYGVDFGISQESQDGKPYYLLHTPFRTLSISHLQLASTHQRLNAALSVCAVEALQDLGETEINPAQINAGLSEVSLPARFETMQISPRVILDGAHNPAKIASLCREIREAFPGQKVRVIYGMLATKDAQNMLSLLAPLVSHWHLTQPEVYGKPALNPTQIEFHLMGIDPAARIDKHENIRNALDAALSTSSPDETIIATGSVYLVGAARNYWYPVEDLLDNLSRAL